MCAQLVARSERDTERERERERELELTKAAGVLPMLGPGTGFTEAIVSFAGEGVCALGRWGVGEGERDRCFGG